MIASGYVPLIVKYMVNENVTVRKKAVYIVGNLMMGRDDVTTSVMRSSVFNHVSHLLLTDEQTISQVAWMTSNAVAGNESMTTIVFDHSLLPLVVSLLQSPCSKVVVDSLWVISNLFNCMSDKQRCRLLKDDTHDVLSAVLPLLSAELSKQTPSKEIISPLCDIFMRILEFVSNREKRDLFEVYKMFETELTKDVYAQLDEDSAYHADVEQVVSFFEGIEEDDVFEGHAGWPTSSDDSSDSSGC